MSDSFRKRIPDDAQPWSVIQFELMAICQKGFELEDLMSQRINGNDRTAKAVRKASNQSRLLLDAMGPLPTCPEKPWRVKEGGFKPEDREKIAGLAGEAADRAKEVWTPIVKWLVIGKPKYYRFCVWGNSLMDMTLAITNEERLGYPSISRSARFS
jgi:hypothetical protein